MEDPERRSLLGRTWDRYENGMGKFVGWCSRGTGKLGRFTANRPLLVLLVSLAITILICFGWGRFRMENSGDELWVPSKSKSRDDEDIVKSQYPTTKQGASFYAQNKADPSANALELPITWEIFHLHAKVLSIQVAGQKADTKVTFADICNAGYNGKCKTNGYLNYFNFSYDQFITDIGGSYTDPTAGNTAVFKDLTSAVDYPDGTPVSLLSVFGGTTFAYNPFKVTSAQVIALDYTLSASTSDSVAKDWHKSFTSLMKEELPKQQYMTFSWITGSSVGEEIGSSIQSDMKLVIISIIIFIIVAILLLSEWDRVRTRTTLAIGGVVVTVLAIVSGYGWAMIFGLPFTVLQQTSPFILLGMGVDVVFILVKGYDIIIAREPYLTLPTAMYKMMASAGTSVQITLLASAVAFALGATSTLNSVKWFSIYATMATLMICLLMITLFMALFVYTEKRISNRLMDCCCCPPCRAGDLPTTPAVDPMTPVAHIHMPPAQHDAFDGSRKVSDMSADSEMAAEVRESKDENWMKRVVRKYYAPALSKWWVKVLVLLLFGAYMGLSFYAITQLKYGQPLGDLAPDGSYLRKYSTMMDDTYQEQVGQPTGVYFEGIDISPLAQQYNVYQALDMTLRNDFVNASTSAMQYNWIIRFTVWVQDTYPGAMTGGGCFNPYVGKIEGGLKGVIEPDPITGCVETSQFYTLLAEWKKDSPSANNYMVMGTGGTTTAFYFSVMHKAPRGDDKYSMDMIGSVRGLEDGINHKLYSGYKPTAVFLWNSNYLYAEGDAILPKMAMEYFILALVGVGFVMLFMLVNPITCILMMCAVGMVDLFLFGELWFLDIRFNQISIINMIMATGLATDYSVYFAQKFMMVTADGTRNGRMVAALTDTGSAVFLGGLTALLGTIPMAFSSSIIIRTFFKLIFGTIIFALLIGLLLMPIIFSLIGPPPLKVAIAMVEELDNETEPGAHHVQPLESHLVQPLESINVQAAPK